jgi:LysR family hydrogen peroxide-inducible transcriptional activator
MPLLLHENFTPKLIELLKQGEIDAAVLTLPFSEAGMAVHPLYDEPFVVALPKQHRWAARASIRVEELKQQAVLLLSHEHCLHDHVLGMCPELARFEQNTDGIQKTFDGSSLEALRYMVASGMGITVLPGTAVSTVPALAGEVERDMLAYVPFEAPVPQRRVALVWRKSFTRLAAVEAIRQAVRACGLQGVSMLNVSNVSSEQGEK